MNSITAPASWRTMIRSVSDSCLHPGVGFITALTYKAGVDDPARFKHSRTVAAHFGLTPRRFQSGEIDIDGHISRCGDRDVRSTLYTAANALLTRTSRSGPHSKPGVCRWLKHEAIGARSSPWPENSLSSCTVCGSMTLSSNGVRRQQGHEITAHLQPQKKRPGVDVVWMKPNISAVLKKHVRKLGSPHRPTYACSGWPCTTSTDCEEKRDPRQDATNSMP